MDTSKYQTRYYYVTDAGYIEYEVNCCDKDDYKRLSIGNYFKTKEEAKESKFYKVFQKDVRLNKNEEGITMTQIELEIFKLCREIGRKTKHSVFYDFRGHVNLVDISIDINGWCSEDDKKKMYLDSNSTLSFYVWESENFKTINLHYYIDLATLEDLIIIKDELGKLLPKAGKE